MIITQKPIRTNLIRVSDLLEYIEKKGSIKRVGKKNVVFCRYIGVDKDQDALLKMIYKIDYELKNLNAAYVFEKRGMYNRFSKEDIENVEAVWTEFEGIGYENEELFKMDMGFDAGGKTLEWSIKLAFREIMEIYFRNNLQSNASTRKNFAFKMLIWMRRYIPRLFPEKEPGVSVPIFLYYGDMKKHDQYFLLLLSKIGCDIIYMNPKADIKDIIEEVEQRSTLLENRIRLECIPDIEVSSNSSLKRPSDEKTIPVAASRGENPSVNIERAGRKTKRPDLAGKEEKKSGFNEREKSYEELARLAKSVVLISVYNEKKEVVGGGSGVVVSGDGFILTNFHVVSRGCLYGISFENDQTEYLAKGIVKYHQDFDLALIKIEKRSEFLNIGESGALVRGQKIVAIGSPLGLFNTVSDGIISGFRKIDNMEVIQITAPISPGSSGGALLDLCGNLIGITTAGFEGQNLNIAVPAKYIKMFANQIIDRS